MSSDNVNQPVRTVAVDFDGVIHRYSRGWADGSIYDPPLPGAIDGLHTLMCSYAVFCHTTRDVVDVARWLCKQDIPAVTFEHPPTFWNRQDAVLVTNRKLPAVAYVDDRAYRFESWDRTLTDAETFR